MSGVSCKIILCICSAAQVMERCNEMLAYRQVEDETIDEHQPILDLIKSELTGLYEFVNPITGLSLVADVSSRRSIPVSMREVYKAVIDHDDSFNEQQLENVVVFGNQMEKFGRRWEKKLLADAWPQGHT